MRQHGVDLAGFRRQVGARHHLAAVVTRHFIEQPLEFGDVTVDGLPEFAVAAVLLADVIEAGLLGSETPKGAVSLRFPMGALDVLFPRLFPET